MWKWLNLLLVQLSILILLCDYCSSDLNNLTYNNDIIYLKTNSTIRKSFNNYENNSKNFNYEKGVEESRGWKKTALPFLLGITLKMTTLLPMVTSLMTIIGGVALLASKLALILSIGLAFHYYLVTKQQLQYRQQQLGHYESVLPASAYPITHKLSVHS